MNCILLFICISSVYISVFSRTYCIRASGGLGKSCEPGDRCDFEDAIINMNRRHDEFPTIDFEIGEYHIKPIPYDFPNAKLITFQAYAPDRKDVKVTVWKNPLNNGTEKTCLFSIVGQPAIVLQNMNFFDMNGIDGVFDCSRCGDGVTVSLENMTISSSSPNSQFFMNFKNMKSFKTLGTTFASSNNIMSIDSSSSRNSDVLLSLKESDFSSSSNLFTSENYGDVISLFVDNSEFFGSCSNIFNLDSKGMEITIQNSKMNGILNTLFTFKNSRSFNFLDNRINGNGKKLNDGPVEPLIQDKLDSEGEYFIDIDISSEPSFSFVSNGNTMQNSKIGLLKFINSKKTSKLSSIVFKNDAFWSNSICSRSLVIIQDSFIESKYSVVFDNVNSQHNIIPSDGYGVITFQLVGDLELSVFGGVYSFNKAENGGAFNIENSGVGKDVILKLSSVFIRNNTVSSNGGGIICSSVESYCKVFISSSSIIAGNKAENGGGVYISSGKSSSHISSLKHLQVISGFPVLNISHSKIQDNFASSYGGGLLIDYNSNIGSGSFFVINPKFHSNSDISRNKAGVGGGGIYFGNLFLLNYDRSVNHNNTCSGNGFDVLTPPNSIASKNKKDESDETEKVKVDLTLNCEDSNAIVTCKTPSDLQFVDGYGVILSTPSFSNFKVTLEFDKSKVSNTTKRTTHSIEFRIDLSDVPYKKTYEGEIDGTLVLNDNNKIEYDVKLQFKNPEKSWFEKYKFEIIIGGLVIVTIIFSCVFVACCCCICLVVIGACSSSPFFDRTTTKDRRKYQVIQSLDDM